MAHRSAPTAAARARAKHATVPIAMSGEAEMDATLRNLQDRAYGRNLAGNAMNPPARTDYLSRIKSAVGDLAHGYWPGQRKRKP